METTKHPLLSKGLWGGLVALACSLGLLGEISASDQAALTDQIVAALGAIGAIAAIIGRWVAKARIAISAPNQETP